MSGETEDAVSGWTVDTLKAHIDAMIGANDRRYAERFDAQEKAVDAALASAEKAVGKAEVAAEKRFDNVNEFRGQLADQARDFMPRKEAELQLSSLTERLIAQEKLTATGASRSGAFKDGWGYLVGAVGTIALIAGVVLAVANR